MGGPFSRMPDELRDYIIKLKGTTCYYCGKKTTKAERQIDHIHPVAKGGENNFDNLVVACKVCNRKKSDTDILIFIEKELKRLDLHLNTLLNLKEKLNQK